MTKRLYVADVTVGALMTRPVVSVRPDTTIAALIALMEAHPFNGLPVVDELGVLQGLVTRADLLRRHLAPYRRFIAALDETWTESVCAIMTRHPLDYRACVETAWINGKVYYERAKSPLFREIPVR